MCGLMEGVGGWPKMEVWLTLGGGGCCEAGRILGGATIRDPPRGGAFPRMEDPTGGVKLGNLLIGGAPSIELVGGGWREGGF